MSLKMYNMLKTDLKVTTADVTQDTTIAINF